MMSTLKRFWSEICFDAHYSECSKASVLFWMAGSWFRMCVYGRIMCHFFGHGEYWVDTSYGNPESGADGGYCGRCGHGFHHQYY